METLLTVPSLGQVCPSVVVLPPPPGWNFPKAEAVFPLDWGLS